MSTFNKSFIFFTKAFLDVVYEVQNLFHVRLERDNFDRI